jgi:hypothetical protein
MADHLRRSGWLNHLPDVFVDPLGYLEKLLALLGQGAITDVITF